MKPRKTSLESAPCPVGNSLERLHLSNQSTSIIYLQSSVHCIRRNIGCDKSAINVTAYQVFLATGYRLRAVAYPEFFFGEGTDGRENGDLGAIAP
jgi:hypothetical protein